MMNKPSKVNSIDRPGTATHFEVIGRLIKQLGERIKGDRSTIDAHIGGQYFKTPHPMALSALIHQASHFTGLLGYLATQAEQEEVALKIFLKRFHPRKGYFIDLYAAYQQLWQESPLREKTFEEFLFFQKQQVITPTGYLEHCHGQIETLTIMRHYFQQMKIPACRGQVVMGTGFKNLFAAALAVLTTREVSIDSKGMERREVCGGAILVQRGHYHSLVKAPTFCGSYLKVIERIDADCLREVLRRRGDIKAVYLSTVANPTGEVMPFDQIRRVAAIILDYNHRHPDDPIFVIADQVYNGSLLKKGLSLTAIASISGRSLGIGDSTLDGMHMHDYTITIVSPSKTLGYASARIGFATSGAVIPGDRESVVERMGRLLGHQGTDGVEVAVEKAALGAYVFTPQSWIEEHNQYIRRQLAIARKRVATINARLGENFFRINDPDAGWYIVSTFPRRNLPSPIRNSKDLMIWFMAYGRFAENTGVITRPGSQFGFEAPNLPPQSELLLRSTLAMTPEDLHAFFDRLELGIIKLHTLKQMEDCAPPILQMWQREPRSRERLMRVMGAEGLPQGLQSDLMRLVAAEAVDSFDAGALDRLSDRLRRFARYEVRAILALGKQEDHS